MIREDVLELYWREWADWDVRWDGMGGPRHYVSLCVRSPVCAYLLIL